MSQNKKKMNQEKKAKRGLPDYDNPPVIEVVCGILFKDLEKLLAPYVGILWEKFRDDYPNVQEVSPLAPIAESFDGTKQTEYEYQISPSLPRIWFIHKEKKGIIQIQRDRFLYNWRKVSESDAYPRYPFVMQKFKDSLSFFTQFLEQNNIGNIQPKQYELSYINHIPFGEGFNDLSDINNVFPDFIWKNNRERFLPSPEGINWRTSFLLPDKQGRLHVVIRDAVRKSDGRPIFILELTVRGGADIPYNEMTKWFDMAREWIVRGFSDLTQEKFQKEIWRRKG